MALTSDGWQMHTLVRIGIGLQTGQCANDVRRILTSFGRDSDGWRPYPSGMPKTLSTEHAKLADEAKRLYWQGWRLIDIAQKIGINNKMLSAWKRSQNWDGTPVVKRVELAIEARLCQLIALEAKHGADIQEIDVLMRQLERAAKITKYAVGGGNAATLNHRLYRGGRPAQNLITDDQREELKKAFEAELFAYQRGWYEAGQQHRIRNILKSRQIGATYYFAREALLDALETGRNQIFLSASKAQAHVFKHYILEFVEAVTKVKLSGDPIRLTNQASLYFLGTNARTAQSYHGNVYLDEYFWIPRFREFRKVSSGMALHKKWRQTYISTPSTLAHDAYPFWTGEQHNRGRAKDKQVDIDVSHQALQHGRACPDGQWRQLITVEDAVAGGCDLFDLDQLRMEYSEDEYRNLLLCEFIDDTASVFTLGMLQRCLVDSWVEWDDFKPFAARPLGDRPVWVGYDPSRVRDGASVVVVAPPLVEDGKYRVIEKQTWHDMPFPRQAEQIRQICKRYTVEHVEIDCSGSGGIGVHDLVVGFFPGARKIIYSPSVKASMVAKSLNIIHNGRLEYDAGWRDLTLSLMQIRRTSTPQGGQITYTSGRNEETGHADLGWALIHALDRTKITAGGDTGARSVIELY